MTTSLLNPILSLIFLLSVSSFVFVFSKKINFPYTVSLVITSLLIVPFVNLGYLSFIRDFSLTPDMLFYVFLPILIFESAYNINYKDLLKSIYSIFSLSIFGLILSVLTIATGMYYVFPLFGFNIPFLVCLLFGSLISATDTVAVLTMFKSIGAPKRVVTIFEGESLFNDGTSLALFLVILGLIIEGTEIKLTTLNQGLNMFLSMSIGGIIFGLFTGYLFSRIIGKIKNNEAVEIALTMILAHLTFILSNLIGDHLTIYGFTLHISGVISTTVAGIVMGNYGRYKISPKIAEYMEKFWGFMAFISNSLVFMLLGLTFYDVKIDYFNGFIYLMIIGFLLCIFARALAVFIPISILNKFKIEKEIPLSWQYIFAWGSPRGAISFMMILMIPDNLNLPSWNFPFSIKDFLTIITISTIMFSLFINIPSIGTFIKKLKLNKLTQLEKIEQEQSKIIIFLENINRINFAFEKVNITKQEYDELKYKFNGYIQKSKQIIKEISQNNDLLKRVISIYSLGIQKKYLIELLTYNEIDEKNFKYLLVRIEEKIRKLEEGNIKILDLKDDYEINILEKFVLFFIKKNPSNEYVKNRSLRICIFRALSELKNMKKIDFGFDNSLYDEIIEIYEKRYKELKKNKSDINEKFIALENELFERSIVKNSEYTLNSLKKKGIINEKLYDIFIEKLEERIYS
ncbi:MAG: cation:proton antiporter [Candidatus Gracilibacteria bacterium]|nr:cation:proton antiporter [Candidatus Gracilibacteria bacterium]